MYSFNSFIFETFITNTILTVLYIYIYYHVHDFSRETCLAGTHASALPYIILFSIDVNRHCHTIPDNRGWTTTQTAGIVITGNTSKCWLNRIEIRAYWYVILLFLFCCTRHFIYTRLPQLPNFRLYLFQSFLCNVPNILFNLIHGLCRIHKLPRYTIV